MIKTTRDQVETAYARTLTRIGQLQELAEWEYDHYSYNNTDTLDEIDTATEHACAYARMLGVDFDQDYDC